MNPNIIKFLIVLLTTSIISLVIYRSLASAEKTGEIEKAKNLFIGRIENEIKWFKQSPNDVFNKHLYEKIKYFIKDDFDNNRFSENVLDNLKWKENLSKTLYATYSEKFINQATIVLTQEEWQQKNLEYIKKESDTLSRSEFLESGSNTDDKLKNINKAIDKYYEIKRFIASCNSFNFEYKGMSGSFPIAEVKNKISQANRYQNNSLDNRLTNNCSSLHDGLKKIPQKLLNVHAEYLNVKIYYLENAYHGYSNYRDFADNLYNPIKKEIEELNLTIYPTERIEKQKKLLNNLENVNSYALDYY